MVTTGAMPVSFPVVRLPQAEARRLLLAPVRPRRGMLIPRTGEVRSAWKPVPGLQAASGRANLPYSACLMRARTAAAVRSLHALLRRPLRINEADRGGSGPRVRLAVGGHQPLDRHVSVDLGAGQRRVPEELLHAPEVR